MLLCWNTNCSSGFYPVWCHVCGRAEEGGHRVYRPVHEFSFLFCSVLQLTDILLEMFCTSFSLRNLVENDVVFPCFSHVGCVVLCEAQRRKRCLFALRVVCSSGTFRRFDAKGNPSEESQKQPTGGRPGLWSRVRVPLGSS